MINRICVDAKEKTSEAHLLEKSLRNVSVAISKVYTVEGDFSEQQLQRIASALHNPVVETVRINKPFLQAFTFALEVGFLPGVTDNVATTTTEIINDLLKVELPRNSVASSKTLYLTGKLTEAEVKSLAISLINPLIERYHIKEYKEYQAQNGMDKILPTVHLTQEPKVIEVNLNVSDEELVEIGKKGILDPDTNERRGPLALDKEYLLTIQEYFKKEKRNPTDIELESIAQTWSEHCKHTIFASELDDIKEGIFSKYIKAATKEVRKSLGKDDFCVSVFTDNSGGIAFDEEYLVTHKVETHNSPSALDPFGGAITGIVGVNRDTLGFGMGAKPIANVYGFCFGRPEDTTKLYRGKNKSNPALLPRRIMDGVIKGVNSGGNCSGIPTPHGFVYFDDSYRGKPLVFVGTIGLIPRKTKQGTESFTKQAQAGDLIVVIGGRVGKDGIHGATFSSEALTEGSPATAVQIGDPITQKKFSDAIVYEARDKGLYSSITDNGAGGISCSVAEMAKEAGGFVVDLEKVPLKYPGLQPWEIWISESQERMTLSIPEKNLSEFMQLMQRRGVEATVIGTFTDSGRAIVRYNGKEILNLDMDFLHEGLPQRKLSTSAYPYKKEKPKLVITNHQETFEKMLGAHNVCSTAFISRQYDHEVQANSVIKPLIGKGSVNGATAVIRPVFSSKNGVVLSDALHPRLSELSAYDMAANSIDAAIRNIVSVGGNINSLALLDNFCWCSSNDPTRLAQLKDAAQACYEYALVFKTPFVSGKDSMFNDFKGFTEDEKEIKISALPTLLISSMSVIDDVTKTSTMDLKKENDLIYVLGETTSELGGSEIFHFQGLQGGVAPKVNAKEARILYEKMYQLHQKELLSASAPINQGGLLITLAKMAIAGMRGVDVNIRVAAQEVSVEELCYTESPSRFIVTISPENQEQFEKELAGIPHAFIGTVRDDEAFSVQDNNVQIVNSDVSKMKQIYEERFKEY